MAMTIFAPNNDMNKAAVASVREANATLDSAAAEASKLLASTEQTISRLLVTRTNSQQPVEKVSGNGIFPAAGATAKTASATEDLIHNQKVLAEGCENIAKLEAKINTYSNSR